jgi:hypothetical protein
MSCMNRLLRALVAGVTLVPALFTVTRATPSAVPPKPDATYHTSLASSNASAAAGELPLAAEPLPSPAGPDSSAPQLTAEGNRALLSWMERDGSRAALTFAERTASGWSAARTVVAGSDLVVRRRTCRRFARSPAARSSPTGCGKRSRSRSLQPAPGMVGGWRCDLVEARESAPRRHEDPARLRRRSSRPG